MIDYSQFKALLRDYTYGDAREFPSKMRNLDNIVIDEYGSLENAAKLREINLQVNVDEVADDDWPIVYAICRVSGKFDDALNAQMLIVWL